jgi:hypothetical protein
MVDCPYSYLPEEFAVDFDRTARTLGPYGTGPHSLIKRGQCPIDSDFYDEDDMMFLGQDHMEAFDQRVDGQLFWNFRNELEDRWSYVIAYDKGWIRDATSNQIASELDHTTEFTQ